MIMELFWHYHVGLSSKIARPALQIAYPYLGQKIGTSKDVPGTVILAG